MKKMKTLFKKDPNNLGRVIDDLSESWITDEGVTAHIKRDGSSCMVKDGQLYKRYDAKRNRKTGVYKIPPKDSIACCDPDEITGHWPHWVPVTDVDKWHNEALSMYPDGMIDGTYELCGPKINGNNDRLNDHVLFRHDGGRLYGFDDLTCFNSCLDDMKLLNREGIVFHHPDGRMCKIRRKDFGLDWPIE